MIVNKYGNKIFGANLTAAEKKAMNIEIQKQLAEYNKQNAEEMDAIILNILHEEFGFGESRLKRVHKLFMKKVNELSSRYETTDNQELLWISKYRLREYGYDIDKWDKED